jgi:transposase
MLEEKAKEKNEKILEQILIHLATNYRMLKEDEHEKFMNDLTRNLKSSPGISFSRDKMEELRFMTNMGVNKAK